MIELLRALADRRISLRAVRRGADILVTVSLHTRDVVITERESIPDDAGDLEVRMKLSRAIISVTRRAEELDVT